jgi:cysteine sulfinate desulfinase/cysteine desulfurase-like protein
VALIAGLGEASRLAHDEADALVAHMLTLKLRLISGLQKSCLVDVGKTEMRFNGPVHACEPVYIEAALQQLRRTTSASQSHSQVLEHKEPTRDEERQVVLNQLPNTVSVSFRDVLTRDLMPGLQKCVACSAGSACHSGSTSMSPVLSAMGVPPVFGLGTLRLSWGRHTTGTEIDDAVRAIAEEVIRIRLQSH